MFHILHRTQPEIFKLKRKFDPVQNSTLYVFFFFPEIFGLQIELGLSVLSVGFRGTEIRGGKQRDFESPRETYVRSLEHHLGRGTPSITSKI